MKAREIREALQGKVDPKILLSNQATRGGDYGLPWSVYLSNDKPDAWLEEFINQQEAQ